MQATSFGSRVGRLTFALYGCLAAASAPCAVADSATRGARITIGIPAPQAETGEGAQRSDAGEPIRQNLASLLDGRSIMVVRLQSTGAQQIDAEATAQHCDYVLYSRVEQEHGGSVGGFLHKLAPLASALPMLGGVGRGGGMSSALSAVGQSAASASASASQQEMMKGVAGTQRPGAKSGDTVTFEYRLTAPGSAEAIKADKLVVKANADGEDLMGPVLAQVANAVTAAAGRAGGDGAVGSTPVFRADVAPVGGGRRSPAGGNIDCDHLPASASGVMSAEACRKLMGAQQAYDQAAADPSAARPGDEQMSCEQITAELKQQRYTAPDKARVAEGQAAAAKEQATLARQESEIAKTAAAQTAALDAARASDTATAVATAGVVRPNKAGALEQVFRQQNKVMGERMAEERRPTETRLMNSTSDTAADAGQQLASNPRLARLMQLANARRCKGT